MKSISSRFLILVVSLFFVSASINSKTKFQLFEVVQSEDLNFPKPVGWVNDFEHVFTEKQFQKIEKTLSDYERKTSKEIVVVSLSTIDTITDFNEYALSLSNEWGVGKKKSNNGLTIVFSKSLRKIRICTGLGTEKILTDNICKQIIDEIFIPHFKAGNYYEGVEKGISKIIDNWN